MEFGLILCALYSSSNRYLKQLFPAAFP